RFHPKRCPDTGPKMIAIVRPSNRTAAPFSDGSTTPSRSDTQPPSAFEVTGAVAPDVTRLELIVGNPGQCGRVEHRRTAEHVPGGLGQLAADWALRLSDQNRCAAVAGRARPWRSTRNAPMYSRRMPDSDGGIAAAAVKSPNSSTALA